MKTLAFALFTFLPLAASAAEERVVLRDTRQYDMPVVKMGGVAGCKTPVNEAAPQPGECFVQRERIILSGELLVRYPEKGSCVKETWRLLPQSSFKQEGLTVSAPGTQTLTEFYACDANGLRVSSLDVL